MGARLIRIVTAATIAAALLGGESGSAVGQESPTTQPPSTQPAKCEEGVTFKRLKRQEAHEVVVKASKANVRELPGLGCPILRSFRKGKELSTTGRRARSDKAVWLQVKGKFGRGWIYQGLVRDA